MTLSKETSNLQWEVVRSEIRVTGSKRGALVFRFADSPGLRPQPVRVQWPPR